MLIARTFLVTMVTLIIGVPACVLLTSGIARLSGPGGWEASFAVAIGGILLWTLLLFGVLWFDAGLRRSPSAR